jgi:hypothetical protein
MLIPKNKPYRDRKYLDWLRDQPCFVTGTKTNDYETVDPAHTGTYGKGLKSPDNHSLPLLHSLHAKSHNNGSVSFWCAVFKENPHILNELLSCYGENVYFKQYIDEFNPSL